MGRLTENDTKLGPLTFGKSSWNPIRFTFSTGGGCDGHKKNHLTFYLAGYVFRLDLFTKFKPYRKWVDTSHYSWGKPGGGYFDEHSKDYGVSYHEGYLQVFLGPQTGDSRTEKSRGYFIPWTQWRFVRRSLYNPDGTHFWTEPSGKQVPSGSDWDTQEQMRESVPKTTFLLKDYDGEIIKATTHIEEWEWLFGEGYFKWLSWFRKPMTRRRLEIMFSSEVGPEKGSWKGGTIGHSIDMLKGETVEKAFKRYCEAEHQAKGRKFKIEFLGDE